MPKEMITKSDREQPFAPTVQWGRDFLVQLGMQVTDVDKQILDVTHGNPGASESIGRVFAWWVAEELPKMEHSITDGDDEWFMALGRQVISWVRDNRGDGVNERDGIWCDLNRKAINELIVTLRRARDQAYGKDA